MAIVDRSFDHPMKVEEKATMPLAGGIMQYGYQCGMIWGGAIGAGAQAYRLYGTGPKAETAAIIAAQRVLESFRDLTGEINCLEITEMDWKPSSKSKAMLQIIKFFIKGGPIGCFRMTAGYAPIAFSEINNSFSENNIEAPSPPVSCAAMLAEKMGASEMHTVMASGLAGGIGLSGGACGALGAAIWIKAMNSINEGGGKISYKDPEVLAAIDKFLKSTDYEFECSKIAGKKFENIEDHAAYLRDGGCSELLDVLAAK